MSEDADIVWCEVFRSTRRAMTYLYVDRNEGMERVPDALLEGFGEPVSVLTLELHASRKLAHADPVRVLDAIQSNGYYLQVPPSIRSRAGEMGDKLTDVD